MNFMSDQPTKNQVVSFLQAQVCGSPGFAFMKDCSNQIQAFVPYLIQYLQPDYPKQQICEILKLCPDTQATPKSTSLKSSSQIVSDAKCQFSQLGKGEVSLLLQNEQANSVVLQQLGDICEEQLFFDSFEFAALFWDS
eukprot:TRINITY_DN5624_c0_g2_i2.p3 TRINITY_DN5624_c0_g2~~TRINITY_DN5624_c0_g2_i2.p3  ORF type:complete len:138 (+),score=24.53 TRINITY_DN5624_c0_g2_i2:2-415(+)